MQAGIYKIVKALDNDLRLLILDKLKGTPMTEKELFEQLSKERPDLKYRESLYRQVETLVQAGLVKKFYDMGKRRISYACEASQVFIDLRAMDANIVADDGSKVISQ
jgi:Fe2+ or Zn2+ uptake regulation protein